MSRSARRVSLAAGYLLHHQPYRETSRILEVFTLDHGRLTLFARGVRGPKAKLAAVLQPFQRLLLSWTGRGEAAQLTGAELAGPSTALPSAALMPAFYLNELLIKLTTRHDPIPPLFDAYAGAVEGLREGAPVEPTLRVFEKRLLEALGYGLELGVEAQGGRGIEPDAYYHFRPSQGLVPAVADAPGALAGRSLEHLADERLELPRDLEDARLLLQAAIAQALEGRELATRTVARAMVHRGARQATRPEGPGGDRN